MAGIIQINVDSVKDVETITGLLQGEIAFLNESIQDEMAWNKPDKDKTISWLKKRIDYISGLKRRICYKEF